MNVTVVGAGKMGLPLACVLASRGARVRASDKRQTLVDEINAGRLPFEEPGLEPLLNEVVRRGALTATTNTSEAVAQSQVCVVIVPVVLDARSSADLSIITEVTEEISKGLQPGSLVSYETTLPVGETRKLGRILEREGLQIDRDFDLVFSPERVKSRFVLKHLSSNPKIVGGSTPKAAKRGEQFYAEYLGAPVINVGSLEAAELVKLAGMIYRDVNIALANELAGYAQQVGVSFAEVRRAANTDGEAALLEPGIGVGGHWAPFYPHFVLRDAETRGMPLQLSAIGREVNASQPDAMVERLGDVRGKRVVILGLAFRPGVKESAYSTAYALRESLARRGAKVALQDPLYTTSEITREGFESFPMEEAEVIVLNTAHPEFASIDFKQLARNGAKVVIDGRNLWDPAVVRAAGLRYVGVGVPDRMQD